MPYNATATASPVDQIFPAGTVPGGWRFTCDGPTPTGIITVTSTIPEYTFTNLNPGDYTFTGVRLADDGVTELGPVHTVQRTIADPIQVTKSIIILEPTKLGNIRFALWIPIPPEIQADYIDPTAVSAWPLITPAEQQAQNNGEIFEIVDTIRGGQTTEAVHAILEAKYAKAVANINALVGFTLENDYLTEGTWVEA